MKYKFKNTVAGSRPSQAYIVQGKAYFEIWIFCTKGTENEVHCLRSWVKYINGNTDRTKNPDGDICDIATLPTMVNGFFLLPVFALSGVEVSRS